MRQVIPQEQPYVVLSKADIAELIESASRIATAEYAARTNPKSDSISLREAHRKFGRSLMDKWIEEGLVVPMRSSDYKAAKQFFSLAQLLKLREAEIMGSCLSRHTDVEILTPQAKRAKEINTRHAAGK